MRKFMPLGAWAVLAIALAAAPASAQPEFGSRGRCQSAHEFHNWKAPDARTIYVRFGLSRYVRLDLAANCQPLVWPDSHLVTIFRGSDSICAPVDWDLRVAQPFGGAAEGCIVKSMRELSPAEVDAIPKRFKP
jgi:hypothetical protein